MPIAGILIDPDTRRVVPVKMGRGQSVLAEACKLIDCTYVEVASFGKDGSVMYCNEEGRYKSQAGFTCHDNVIVGKAVVVGPVDKDGNDTDTTWTITAVQTAIKWVRSVPELK